uniref:ABC transporter permease n=1 Tax=Ningiella ruwaisensis TaxID=2364274 RepID=UPI00109FFAC5|nr:ABC transporter permease [Ningiella ruwaisensis]
MSSTTVLKRSNWEIWKDVIFALLMREVRTGFNDKLGISWAVINPLLFIIALAFLRGLINGEETHTLSTFTFMAVGILFIQGFLQILNGTVQAVSKNKSLYSFRQVQPISSIIAALIFETLVKLFTLLGVGVFMYYMGIEIQMDNALLFLLCLFSVIVLAASLGLFFSILEMYISEVKKVRQLATRPLFFISAVFFSLQDIPKEYWKFLDWNPILHAIELARYGASFSYGNEGVSLQFLLLTTLTLLFGGLAVYNAFWKMAVSR